MTAPTRVLVVDDHALFRDGMAALLARWPEFEVVGQAQDGAQATRKARRLRPDLVLMDVRMQPVGGVAATREICRTDAHVRVVMLTMSSLGEDVFQALRGGAVGYISKDEPAAKLREYLQAAMRGETALSASLAAQVLTEFARPAGTPSPAPRRGRRPAALTARELQVLRLLVDGQSNGEIAENLNLAEATVKKHLGRVMAKLHKNNRVQVAVYSVREGIVEPR